MKTKKGDSNIKKGFWDKFKALQDPQRVRPVRQAQGKQAHGKIAHGKPFFAIAPMADVTDIAFRQMFVKYGRPDVFWTEFVSADGLCSAGREVLLKDLAFSKKEKPIVAQIFSSNPENCLKTAQLIAKLGFDGIDINMGCPDRNVEKQGAGAALMKNPKLAQEIIRATKVGAGKMPVSVKTRIGYNKDQIDEWIPKLLEMDIAALTVHGRTRKEMSDVPARWEDIARVVKIRDKMGKDTLIIGNGDVQSLEDGLAKAQISGVDGVMVGRGVFGNPWFFNKKQKEIPTREKLKVLVEHTKLFEKKLSSTGIKNFAVMKKHFKAYVTGFDRAKELRMELMETTNAKEVEKVISTFLKNKDKV
jgi:nifR3 family TIM-barrel protein